ncbi:MAG: chromosome segregation protein [Betaproteobacteria bacterium ADurb.Bin341]|nr:MAG: chromosome segregation protein [Betaproteobacteria bacterium ADurb.Bin341]
MKLIAIQTGNFLGARAVDVTLTKPITLFAGKNYSGKSSLQEAVRMALTGESVRVGLKKDYGALVTEGQESGFVEVSTTDGAYSVVLPSGKGVHCDKAALPYVLDAQRFARMSADERRAFLFGLMGLRTDGEAVKDRLTTRGCDAQKIERIVPFLRAGFDAGQKEAAGKAREAKGAWKSTTGGETYGSNKAASWKAEKPFAEFIDAGKLIQAKADLLRIEEEIEAETGRLGALTASAQRYRDQAGRLAELREKAAKYARLAEKLAVDERERDEWTTKVADTRAKAGRDPHPLKAFTECPVCHASLLVVPGNRLVKHEPIEDDQTADPEAVANLPKYEQALALLEKSVANDKRDLEAANSAAMALKEMESAGSIELPKDEEITALKARVDALKSSRTSQQANVRTFEEAVQKANEADEKTRRAAELHQEVQAWETIADALAPDGIPGEMLAEALGPINKRLGGSAVTAGWSMAQIGADMAITADGRAYALLSESEKWRADAMIAEAVAHISKIRLLVLDRLDVLDLQGRDDLLYWLDVIAQDGEIETALIFGTLKALPAQLPETIEAFWIENGVVGHIKAAA